MILQFLCSCTWEQAESRRCTDTQRCHSPSTKRWQSWREKLRCETNVREARESTEVMHSWSFIEPEQERLEGDLSVLASLLNLLFFCLSSWCHPGAAPEVPVQSYPAELEDEDSAAKLFLFRTCPESFRIISGGFTHFIHSICSLPWGVQRSSLLAQAQPIRQPGGGAHYCPISRVSTSRHLSLLEQYSGLGWQSSAGQDAWTPWVTNSPAPCTAPGLSGEQISGCCFQTHS